MFSGSFLFNECVVWDVVMIDIVDYVCEYLVELFFVYMIVWYCLIDILGCGLVVLLFLVCSRLFGLLVLGIWVVYGVRVLGIWFELDLVQVVFNIGVMVCWLDFNDIWLVVEWGYFLDNFGGILVIVDWFSCNVEVLCCFLLIMCDVFVLMIKVYEIQGCFVLENVFNWVGLDYVVLVKVVFIVVVVYLFGLDCECMFNVVLLVWVDGQVLCMYWYVLNIGLCKSWVVGDVISCVVCLVLMVVMGEMGYFSVLIVLMWGFYDVFFGGQLFCFQCFYGSYVMENVLFKISYLVEFYGQIVVEVVMQVYVWMWVVGRCSEDIEWIILCIQQVCLWIIDKFGLLYNLVDCDYCVQYMVVIVLIFGWLVVEDYEDDVVVDLCIDLLCVCIVCVEELCFIVDYLDLDKCSIVNVLYVIFKDGIMLEEMVEYLFGYVCCCVEGILLLEDKFCWYLVGFFLMVQQCCILDVLFDLVVLEVMFVYEYLDFYVVQCLVLFGRGVDCGVGNLIVRFGVYNGFFD